MKCRNITKSQRDHKGVVMQLLGFSFFMVCCAVSSLWFSFYWECCSGSTDRTFSDAICQKRGIWALQNKTRERGEMLFLCTQRCCSNAKCHLSLVSERHQLSSSKSWSTGWWFQPASTQFPHFWPQSQSLPLQCFFLKVLFCKLMPTINPLVQILLAGTCNSLTAAACLKHRGAPVYN